MEEGHRKGRRVPIRWSEIGVRSKGPSTVSFGGLGLLSPHDRLYKEVYLYRLIEKKEGRWKTLKSSQNYHELVKAGERVVEDLVLLGHRLHRVTPKTWIMDDRVIVVTEDFR